MRLLLVGHGRMGSWSSRWRPTTARTIAGVIDEHSSRARHRRRRLRRRRRGDRFHARRRGAEEPAADWRSAAINVVIGTTGWQAHEAAMRDDREAGRHRRAGGVEFLARHEPVSAGRRRGEPPASRSIATFGAWIHESHHAMKKDAPSGTALPLKAGMERAGYARPIDVSSTRVGSIPGTHTVGFDGPSETIEFTHTVRDRAVFARGALEARAQWLDGPERRHGFRCAIC